MFCLTVTSRLEGENIPAANAYLSPSHPL